MNRGRFAEKIKTLPAILALSIIIHPGFTPAPGSELISARVSSVIDGDTIVVQTSGETRRVRLIGIDSPELARDGRPGEFMAEQAKTFLRETLEGTRVSLKFDFEREDRYGRWLCYVFNDTGEMVNEIMLRRGLALVILHFPFREKKNFIELQHEAARKGRGLFKGNSLEAVRYNSKNYKPVKIFRGPSRTYTVQHRDMAKTWVREEEISSEVARIMRYGRSYPPPLFEEALKTDGYIPYEEREGERHTPEGKAGPIGYRDARDYVHETVTLEGTIVRTKNTGKVTFLDFDPDWKTHLSVVIFPKDAAKFPEPPETLFLGKNVRVRGTVKIYKGKPEIVIRDPGNIEIIQDP